MKASVVDLRYKMNDVLKALDRNEEVTVLYHGKVKGVIVPAKKNILQKITDHPFFGMNKSEGKTPVPEVMETLRKPRYDAL
ncbi:MAG: type II toxin-antitoxin system Phd/YefM family antitoxin [Calditrichaeota bacterium]|nr:MAG: type II toxin-antitoxin system Phd/YefM family antitoxin [Calditrichota bacterium]